MSSTLEARAAATVKKKASGSSFYLAMRLMPEAERDAMFAIYAFCRKVDDIADDGIGTREERRRKIDAWRDDIAALYRGQPSGQARFLEPIVAAYGLRQADFLTVLDGMAMDVAEDIVAPDLATLDLYCDRVASAVGRLSIKVFGMDEGPGFELAHHLGRALQLTNILRDIDEDADIGRLYLPREYLFEMSCAKSLDPNWIVNQPQIDQVCRKVAMLAHAHYEAAKRIMAGKPRGRIATPRLMGAVYSEILSESEKRGFAPPRKRVSLGKWRLLTLVAKHGLG